MLMLQLQLQLALLLLCLNVHCLDGDLHFLLFELVLMMDVMTVNLGDLKIWMRAFLGEVMGDDSLSNDPLLVMIHQVIVWFPYDAPYKLDH
jgi:hypothetical protein